jgi:dihydroorotase
MRFDTLVKGGRLIDPAQGHDGQFDVAVADGRVAAVDREIPADAAYRVVDAAGRCVTPGLIDYHSHVFHHFTYWGLDPDTIGPRTGVTTWIDAGSAGSITLPGFERYIVRPAAVGIQAFLNISYIGLIAPEFELRSMEYCDVDLFERVYRSYSDLIVGVKVRMGTPTVGANGVEPLRQARAAAARCELPVMVHIAEAPPEIEDVLALMEPGDIITHCFRGDTMKLVDADGRVLESAKRAIDGGVILDVGHGAGGMTFASADAMIAAGLKPHVISTDLHQMSHHGPAVMSSDAAASPFIFVRDDDTPKFDLPTALSKFMATGLTLEDVIAAATARPADLLHRGGEIGTLAPGARGDIAVFELESGRFEFKDVSGDVRTGTERLVNVETLIGGQIAARVPAAPPAVWVDLVADTTDG